MKKFSVLLLATLISMPAGAEILDEDYGAYDDDFDTEETYSPAPTTTQKSGKSRDTYAGLRIHRNEHIVRRRYPLLQT